MPGHFPTLVISYALAHPLRHAIERGTEVFHRRGRRRVVNRLATDVGIYEVGCIHAAQLAGNLLGRQTLTQHVSHQLETLSAWQQLALGASDLASTSHTLLGIAGRVAAAGILIATQLSTDGRRRSTDQASNPAQAEALDATKLDGHTLFDAEFVIGRRANTVPARIGVALSFRGRPIAYLI